MEMDRQSQRWKMHLLELEHSRITLEESERGKTERAKDRGRRDKSVTITPASRYLTDRRYTARKPLFSTEQCASILRTTQTQTVKEKCFGVSRAEETPQHTDISFPTKAELTAESFSPSHSDISAPSSSREDLDSPLAFSELRTMVCHEQPTFESPLHDRLSILQRPSSSVLEVQRPNPPLRPQLTSTVLYPTYNPRSGHSNTGQTPTSPERSERGRVIEKKLCSPGCHSKVPKPMSPYQANYWACAIPKTLPPSPDRHSADWDPNREYQALLDYAYPLRPGDVAIKWGNSDLQGGSQTDPCLHDSGIGLDHFYSSTSLLEQGLHVSDTGQSQNRGTLGVGHLSPDLQRMTKSSDGLLSIMQLSQRDPTSLSLDKNKNRIGRKCYRNDHYDHQHHMLLPYATPCPFIPSTSVFPLSSHVWGEEDDEFRPLPVQLEELKQLSRKVRGVTALLSRPLTASCDSLEPGITSNFSTITLPERQESEDKVEENEVDNQDKAKGESEADRNKTSADQTVDHRVFEAMTVRSGSWVEPIDSGLNRSSLREVEALAVQLCGLTLPSSQENQEQSDSLMQHIQVFCSHLKQLIQQLYTVSEKMELPAVPTVDIDSVKSSLAEYQSFQREVNSNQPLTSSVLHTGQLLLNCINAMSPFLRDTLLLIEKQSGALGTHTEHLFSSILSSMDSLSQPKPVQQSREEDPGLVGVKGSA